MSALPRGLGSFAVGCVDFLLKDIKWKSHTGNFSLPAASDPHGSSNGNQINEGKVDRSDDFSSGTGSATYSRNSEIQQPFFRLYYPTNNPCTSEFTPWLPSPSKRYLDGFLAYMKVPLWASGLAHFLFGSKKIPAHHDAPLLTLDSTTEMEGKAGYLKSHKKGKLPIILFSHGKGSNRAVYSSICCDLASRGFLVASVEARDGSAAGTYFIENDKMEWVNYRKRLEEEDEFSVANSQLCQRSAEVVDVFHILHDIAQDAKCEVDYDSHNVLESKFKLRDLKGKLDTDNIALVGHSFGAATVINVLGLCKGIRCGVCLDVWMLPVDPGAYGRVDHPLVFVNSESFHWPKNIVSIQRLNACHPEVDRDMVTIWGSNHYSASDVPFIRPSLSKWLGLSDTSIIERIMQRHREITWEFLKKNMDLNDEQVNMSLLRGGEGCPDDVLIGTNVNIKESPKSAL